jgi:NitT/TauT family transport system permease protein
MKRLQVLLPFVGVAVLLAVWSLTVWARVVDPVLLPSPISTFRAMWIGMTSGKLGVDFLKTIERTTYSTAIAAEIAIPLGTLLGSSEKVYRSVEFLIDLFRSTPASAMFPLFLVLFGLDDRTKISVAAFGAALLILFNVAYGGDERAQDAHSGRPHDGRLAPQGALGCHAAGIAAADVCGTA